MPESIAVTIEETRKRTFATASDWPGWSRSGKTEAAALAAFTEAGHRYATVAQAAGLDLPPAGSRVLEVVERLEGGSGTDFGVPSRPTRRDERPSDAVEAGRIADLVAAAWATFDRVAAEAPEDLRKGPRGGGRDRSKIVAHVTESDQAYAREIGVRLKPFAADDRAAVTAMRAAMLEALRLPSDGSPLAGRRWPGRYAANRIAWHALDHAWEILDRMDGPPTGDRG